MKLEHVADDVLVFSVESSSKPGIVHDVRFDRSTGRWWCGCPGFAFHNRCRHIPTAGIGDGASGPGVRSYVKRGGSRMGEPRSPHLPPKPAEGVADVAEKFVKVRAGCEALATVDAEFRDAIRHRHGYRMAFRILEEFGATIVPPEGMTVRDLADTLPSIATIIRWTLPLAKEIQSTEELLEGQRLREAHRWVATNIENGQARLEVE